VNNKKTKASMPFIKAYQFLLERKDLKSAEKLLLITLCRFWPSPFWGSNATLADMLGISLRRVERILKRLKSKKFIKAGYAHKPRDGKNHTVRVIVPLCMPEKCVMKDFEDAEQIDGCQTELNDGSIPSNCVKSTVKQADLIERNRRMNIKATALPLPAQTQAKPLIKNNEPPAVPIVRNFSQVLKGTLHKASPLTESEFERRRQEQIRRLIIG